MGHLLPHQGAPQLKDRVHGLNEPEVVGGEPLCQLGDLGDQVCPDVLVRGGAQVRYELLRYDRHVPGVGHLEQEVQSLHTGERREAAEYVGVVK